MSVFRRLGPYVACLVAGLGSGAGLAYLLYIRLNRELAEIRKLIHELRHEIDLYSNNSQRKKNRPRITGQYSITASSGDDDDDFVDCVAGLSDNTLMSGQTDPELVSFVQSPSVKTEQSEQLTNKMPEGGRTEETPVSFTMMGDQLSPVKEVVDIVDSPLLTETEEDEVTESMVPDDETETKSEVVP